jgi:hypothetical protein
MNTVIPFLSSVYSEDLYPVSEQEYSEVMQAIATEDGLRGYGEWSERLEQGRRVDTPHGEILINKECSHPTCMTTRCDRAQSYMGIAI